MTDTAARSVVLVGEGPRADEIALALRGRGGRGPISLHAVPDPSQWAVDAVMATPSTHGPAEDGLLQTPVIPPLVVEASPDEPLALKAAMISALLDGLPGRVPLVIVTRTWTVASLLPSMRSGSRAVGLNLVRARADASLPGPPVAEVVLPGAFDDATVDAVLDLLESVGLVALPCADGPGRMVDRLVASVALEAHALVCLGRASSDAVAAAIRHGGLDLAALGDEDVDRIAAHLHSGLDRPARFGPVATAQGAGPADPASLEGPPSLRTAALAERLELAVIAEAYRLVEEAVAGAEEIERAMTQGAGWTVGPFARAGRRGLRAVVTGLAALSRDPAADAATADRFAIPRLLWQMATV